jgi:hypothetical protein
MVRRRSTVRFRKGAPGQRPDSKRPERVVGPEVGPTCSLSGGVPGQRGPTPEKLCLPESASVQSGLGDPGRLPDQARICRKWCSGRAPREPATPRHSNYVSVGFLADRSAVGRPAWGGWSPLPTRFPTMLTSVHRRPEPSANWADACWVAAGERCRTGVNE